MKVKIRHLLGAGVFTSLLVHSIVQADHASVTLGTAPSGPISTTPGATLSEGSWSIGLRNEYIEFDDFSDERLIFLREERIERFI